MEPSFMKPIFKITYLKCGRKCQTICITKYMPKYIPKDILKYGKACLKKDIIAIETEEFTFACSL